MLAARAEVHDTARFPGPVRGMRRDGATDVPAARDALTLIEGQAWGTLRHRDATNRGRQAPVGAGVLGDGAAHVPSRARAARPPLRRLVRAHGVAAAAA